MISGFVDFEFDLPEALLARLVKVFDKVDAAPLHNDLIDKIPDAQGVYQLLFDNNLVYIGKTDAQAGLRRRLDRHRLKIQQRTNLDPANVSFKAVRIYVFTPVDLETQLIAHYGGSVPWNGSGFGSNDPGRERDTTRFKKGHFELRFPIDIDRPLNLELPIPGSAANVAAALKTALPYLFRYDRSNRIDLQNATVVTAPPTTTSAKMVVQKIVEQLPPGWQATRLPYGIILYKEAIRAYPHGEIIALSPNSPGAA